MSLRTATLGAARWTAAAAAFRVVLQVAQVSLLARILEPSDFGLMAMAGTVTAIAALFSDLGLSSALIHFPLPGRKVLRSLFVLNLAVGLLLWAIVTALAPSVASLYNSPQLSPLLMLLGIVFPIGALSQQARALAEKSLEFRALARIEVASVATGFFFAAILAWAGAGVLSIAAGIIITTMVNSLSLLVRRARSEEHKESENLSVRTFLSYGMHRLAEQTWNALRQQSDTAMAAYFGSPHAVALYATPRDHSLRVANTIINPVVTRIAFPVMSGLQDDCGALAAVYLKALRFTASANFPIFFAIACFPVELLQLFLGPKWVDASLYLRIFALWGMIRSTGQPAGGLLYAVGMVRRANYWNLCLLLATLPLMWLSASRYGLVGLAICMLLLQCGIFFLTWRFLVFPAARIPFRAYISQLFAPMLAALIASAFAVAATVALAGEWRLVAGLAVFSLTYLGASLLWNRQWIFVMKDLMLPVLRPRQTTSSASVGQ